MMKRCRLPLLLFPLTWLFFASVRADENPSTADAQLEKLLDDAWEFQLREDPLFASRVGDHRYDDRLPRVTVADAQRRLEMRRGFLQRAEQIDRDALSPVARVNRDIFVQFVANDVAEDDLRGYLMPITNRWGFHIEFPDLPKRLQLETTRDYQNYVARLQGFGDYADQHIDLLREAIREGFTLPAVVLRDYATPIEAQIVEQPEDSLLYAPFHEFPDGAPEDQRAELSAAGRKAIAESVVPGYRRFLAFMRDEYIPAARGQIGASALPRGREYYRHRVRKFTTLDISPEEVHQIGLEEVRRIRAEMDEVVRKAKFEGTRKEFVEFLRSDPQFYAETPEALLQHVALIMKRMDGQLPRLFRTLPRMPYGIREIPAYIAPQTTSAYYSLPAGDGSRAGFYYVNTYNLKSRPLYEMQALSLHEAVPGHHLQLALQQELGQLPAFRRHSGFTAFVEGWALYAERLGLEVGFYQDPYSDFGRLSFEMWRACRLVVDTGMHYLGWSRQRAIDFMAENTALSLHNVTTEIDRYISWPGQALAYKMGELKIRELRRLAEQQLGDDFDVREFHEVVLGSGSVPLQVLENNVLAWLKEHESKE